MFVSSGQDLLDARLFCEEQCQPGSRERRPSRPKTRNRAPISGCRDSVHNLCRCLQQSNLVQAVTSWTQRCCSSTPSGAVYDRHTRVGALFHSIPGSGRSFTTHPGWAQYLSQEAVSQHNWVNEYNLCT